MLEVYLNLLSAMATSHICTGQLERQSHYELGILVAKK